MKCVIPQRYHRQLMGLRGSRVQLLSREHAVEIKFPDRASSGSASAELPIPEGTDPGKEKEDWKCDTIILTGREENCKTVEAILKKLVPVTVEVDVPYPIHRFIIGQRGSNIRKMMEDYNVR
ncbi:vigilin-like [Scyliorhinus torazame]|uniref:vigilin-like n=1 Tax=Scyliorhinus torazame TaxID=75743 RepID=UPI003B5A8F98